MKRYAANQPVRRRLPRRLAVLVVGVLIVAVIGVVVTRLFYNNGLRPVSSSQSTVLYTVKPGTTVKQVAVELQAKHLIKSAWAMQLYVHSKELTDNVQAGTYALSPSQGTIRITTTLTTGKVTRKLVTILPGRRIDQVRADLINSGFTPAAVDSALNPANYTDVPVLSYKPATVTSLEGLLWPNSYEKDQTGSPASVIREALVAMGDHLTPDVQAAFASEGLTTYQGVTLASIIVQEVNKPADQAQVAQVFLSRLKAGTTLGSDVTARYGAIIAGHEPSLSFDSPYNTLKNPGLPPGPLSTITTNGLNAATHPAATNWLYFVAGDDGTTYFSTNLQDHQDLTQKYCHKLCGQ